MIHSLPVRAEQGQGQGGGKDPSLGARLEAAVHGLHHVDAGLDTDAGGGGLVALAPDGIGEAHRQSRVGAGGGDRDGVAAVGVLHQIVGHTAHTLGTDAEDIGGSNGREVGLQMDALGLHGGDIVRQKLLQ